MSALITILILTLIRPIQKDFKKLKKWKSWHMETHLTVLRESHPMNTNMTGLRWLSKVFVFLSALKESSPIFARVKDVHTSFLLKSCAIIHTICNSKSVTVNNWFLRCVPTKHVPKWQGLDGFQKSFYPCALKESSLSSGSVKDDHTSLFSQLLV